jgi:hypothetical protein
MLACPAVYGFLANARLLVQRACLLRVISTEVTEHTESEGKNQKKTARSELGVFTCPPIEAGYPDARCHPAITP